MVFYYYYYCYYYYLAMNKSERTIPFNLRRGQEDLKHASAHHFEILMIILSISCQKPIFFILGNQYLPKAIL